MDDLIKLIQRQLKKAEKEYNFYNEKIKSSNDYNFDDNARRLYHRAQIDAYDNILNYYKQEL